MGFSVCILLRSRNAHHVPRPSISCQPDDREDLNPKCTETEEVRLGSLCADVLLSEQFVPCHVLLAPKPFLDNCVYDMCEYDGMQETLCDNVEAYAQACQSLGITIGWRNNTFCRKCGALARDWPRRNTMKIKFY